MNPAAKTIGGPDLHTIQQVVKWIVYSLLIVNFGFYIYEDVDRAVHTLHAESTWFDLTGEFATTIDTAAWFFLLFMFELETYWLEDEQWKPWVKKTVHGVRIACYVMIVHTVVAYADTVIQYAPTIPMENATSLCDLADDGLSYVYNLDYTEITAESCTGLADESLFYKLGAKNPLVSTYAGLELERDLAMADLVEAIAWLVIVFAIEVTVRLQGRGTTSGPTRSTAKVSELLGYAVLLVLMIYWARLGHWLYTWDNFLWIGGFAAIDINLSEWRDEILSEEAGPLDAAAATED